jgi:C4-dicarboxylate transporter DctQ subunit
MRRIHRVGEAISAVCGVIAAAALTGIVVINAANVASRYFFGSAFAWAEELMIFLMMLTVFAGAATATWRSAHIRIELLVDTLPSRLRFAAGVVIVVCIVLVLMVLAAVNFRIVSMLYAFDQRSLALGIPLFIPQGFVAVGLALIVGLTVLKFMLSLRRSSSLGDAD